MTAEIRLPARLDTAAAAGLRAALDGFADRPVVLNAEDVDHIGGLCLETILLGKARWARKGAGFSIVGLKETALADLRTFGIAENDLCGGGAE